MPHEQLLIGEAADRLGLPAHTLRRACDAGILAVPRAGAVRVFPVDELETYRRLAAAGYIGRIGRACRPAHPIC